VTLIEFDQAHVSLFENLRRLLWRSGIFLLTSSLVVLAANAALASEIGGQGEGLRGRETIAGFRTSPHLGEQELTLQYVPEVRIHINAPSREDFDPMKRVGIVLYALPNGNTIEQTAGKLMAPDDDWHFDIQHIAAQTRFLRKHLDEYNLVVAYLETVQKSWPAWRKKQADNADIIAAIADSLKQVFRIYDPFLILSGHSGGGSFIFGFLSGVESISPEVERISFLDSNYGYNDEYGEKIARWLQESPHNHLSVIAYNDSVALYEGKTFVSATGGTWYRSKKMLKYFRNHFTFSSELNADFRKHEALDGRVQFILIENPQQKIFHTVLVERNGFIQAMLSGTRWQGVDYDFWGERAYTEWIRGEMPGLKRLAIPPRPGDAIDGSGFMEQIAALPFEEREEKIYRQISRGNLPDFLRQMVILESTFEDTEGFSHTIKYQVMPDYLAIGADKDFCRVPMGPQTAQRIADRFGASLPTRKLVDDIYRHADVRLEPVTYYPVGNANERVEQFIRHNADIEEQRKKQDAELGQLTAGTKKDVVISNKIADPDRTHHVVIYGWHKLNGDAIQPLTNIHIDTYVDYSHGVRLVNSEMIIDGVPMEMADVLRDSVLYKLISDEDETMKQVEY
jgi:hypothetical protein